MIFIKKDVMNFGKLLVEELLTEADIKKVIAVYPGRFQPPGKNHAIIFNWVQSKFGKQNRIICVLFFRACFWRMWQQGR